MTEDRDRPEDYCHFCGRHWRECSSFRCIQIYWRFFSCCDKCVEFLFDALDIQWLGKGRQEVHDKKLRALEEEKMKYGFVRTAKGQLRPFEQFRQIQRGRHKGQYEIQLPSGRPRKILATQAEIHRFLETAQK